MYVNPLTGTCTLFQRMLGLKNWHYLHSDIDSYFLLQHKERPYIKNWLKLLFFSSEMVFFLLPLSAQSLSHSTLLRPMLLHILTKLVKSILRLLFVPFHAFYTCHFKKTFVYDQKRNLPHHPLLILRTSWSLCGQCKCLRWQSKVNVKSAHSN